MPRLHPDRLLTARLLGAALLLSGLLYAVPAGLLARDRLVAEAWQQQFAGELALAAEAQLRRGLETVEAALAAAQHGGAAPAGDLLRELRLLHTEDEGELAGLADAAGPEARLRLGVPRRDAAGGWVLPALRPPERAGAPAALALLNPQALLASPAAGPAGSRLLLLGRDGVVRAEAGQGTAALGRPWPAAPPAGPGLRFSSLAGDGGDAPAVQAALPVQGSSLTILALLPVALPGWLALLPGLLAALPLLVGLLLLRVLRQRATEQAALVQGEARLALANARLQLASARADAKTRQLELVLEGLEDGAALLDSQLRFVAWNSRFAALAGLAAEALRPGLPVAELLRSQAGGSQGNGDYSLRQRLAGLQARVNGAALRRVPGGRVEDRWTVLEDDSVLLTCRRVAEPAGQARPATALNEELAALCAEELRKRLPLLQDAALAGDAAAARVEAHAMRGVAANFGLGDFAQSLREVEAAARDGELDRLRLAVGELPAQLDAALALLPALVA